MAGVEIKLGRRWGPYRLSKDRRREDEERDDFYRRREAHQKQGIHKNGGEMPD